MNLLSQDIKFEQFNINDGLSQNTVACILQDRTGFMWFGTRDGLNRYDGYKFTVYKRNLHGNGGLSANDIKAIVEDDSSNLWIATYSGGLNQFNLKTEKFRHFKHNPTDIKSIGSDYIRSLLFDSRGRLWIGTGDNGLDLLDIASGSFTHYRANPRIEGSLSDNTVTSILEDSFNRIWVGTLNGGLNLFDENKNQFRRWQYSGTTTGLPSNNIQFLHEDKSKQLWIGTYGGGLVLYDLRRDTFSHLQHPHFIAGNKDFLLSIVEDKDGNIWIGTENNGLQFINREKGTLKTFYHYDNDVTSVASNSIMSLYADKKGNIWIGTFQGGVNLINSDIGKFRHYKHRHDVNSLSNNTVTSIFEDSKENLWIGTDGGGLNLFNPDKGTFTHFRKSDHGLASDFVLTVAEDNTGKIWIGTWGNGISVYDPLANRFKQFRNSSGNGALSNDYAFYIFKDRDGTIWVGTYGGGLNKYDPVKNEFVNFRHDENDPTSISTDYILTIFEDHNGNLWIGTDGGGLNAFNKEEKTFKHFKYKEGTSSVSNNIVNTICEDEQGYLWLGTNYGLNKFDPVTRKVSETFFTDHGLPNDVITGIIRDSLNNLWVGTTKGLSKFHIVRKEFKNFTLSDGIQANDFRAQCLSKSGMMYFGGKNGFNEFVPNKIEDLAFDPQVVFTGFQVFNKEVPVNPNDEDGISLRQSISQTKTIDLTYRETVISFEFASLNYTGADKKKYKYLLEGFDKDWNFVASKNSVTYTNLDPGTYKLRVIGLTNDGKWSPNEAMIQINISPPFWQTWWFKTITGMFSIGLVMLIFYIRLSTIKKRNRQLEEDVRKRTIELQEANQFLQESNKEVKRQNEKLEEFNKEIINQSNKISVQQEKILLQNQELASTILQLEKTNATKDRFFSILAHDLKNPVAALTGISDQLKNEAETLDKEELTYYIGNINQSSHAIHSLLSNLLDWGRSHAQHISYNPTVVNVHYLVMKNLALVEQQLNNKMIKFDLHVDTSHHLYADYYMADAIIRNVLSNCIKFTPAYGTIRLESKLFVKHTEIVIADTGIGMNQEQLSQLFSLCKRQKVAGTNGETGTGLGLIITKEFIEINGGNIDIISEPDKGSVFTLTFNAPEAETIQELRSQQVTLNYEHSRPISIEKLPFEKKAKLKGKRILIVDDSEGVRAFLRMTLSGVCEVIEAENGAQAFELAEETQPSIIVTDMVMPVMSGMEFCEKIKSTNSTSHIPVVVLTSQTDEHHHAAGYAAGADVYLTKPLRHNVFFEVLLGIIRNQERIREKFSSSTESFPEHLSLNKLDDEFLKKVIDYIEAHLPEPDLDYRKLCEVAAMSRSLLYSKFKTITGFGVHDFIKSMRLKKGLKLLLEGRLNITQVAYEVGFTTPSHFSKSFTKQYGQSPSDYLNTLKREVVK